MLAPDSDLGLAALLAIGEDDLVLGATAAARAACGITDAMLERDLPAQAILSDDSAGEDLSQAEPGFSHRALAPSGENVSAAAKALGVSRATLHRKMRRLGLHR